MSKRLRVLAVVAVLLVLCVWQYRSWVSARAPGVQRAIPTQGLCMSPTQVSQMLKQVTPPEMPSLIAQVCTTSRPAQ